MTYPNKKVTARTPETRRRNKKRKALLYAALDFLEAPQDLKTERYGSPSVLYTQLLVGVLMRTLTGYMKLPKSRARAEALGIAVSNDFVPAQERKLERKRLKCVMAQRRAYDEEDDDPTYA